MHHITFTVIDKYGGNAISVVDSYVSDIYTSMVKHGITVITSFSGKAIRHYKTSNETIVENALIIQGTTDVVARMGNVIREFNDAPIVICGTSYED